MEIDESGQVNALILDEHRKMAFSIVSRRGTNDIWRLYDGAATVHVAIADANFLARVDSDRIRFNPHAVLVSNVHVRQSQTIDGVKTEYEIMEVLAHRASMRQIRLPGL